MTEAELSCRAQAIRGESCMVQSLMEVSFRANYSNDKNDYGPCKIIDFKIVRTKKLVKFQTIISVACSSLNSGNNEIYILCVIE